jgi:hypothetical protein
MRILVTSVALLLPAGAISAIVVDSPASTSDASGRDVVQAAAPGHTSTSTTAVPVPATSSPTSTVVATTTTRRPPTAATATTAKAVTTTPARPTRPTIQTIPIAPTPANLPPATSWQAEKNGVSVRIRIEPASPIAGQPVLFVIDIVSAQPCCIILVGFGEGSLGASNLAEACSGAEPMTAGASTFDTSHAYAAPGAYRATISVDTDPCPFTTPPVGRAATPDVTVEACFAVGPGTAGQAGCRPSFGGS